MKSNLVDIACLIEKETEKAYLIDDGVNQAWVPKSMVEYDNDEKVMTMPESLAIEKELI